jgi:aminoglycoside phosphotransferase (APT) family kinase protein
MNAREALARHLPGYRVDTVEPLGAGLEHDAFEVNGELVVRIARGDADVEREARLLAMVAEIAPVLVPEPLFAAGGVMAYRKLPGRPLSDGLPRDVAPVVATLRELLAALHAAPVAPLAGLVERDDVPPEDWLRETAGTYERVAWVVPARQRPAVEAFLARPAPPPARALVFSHNDLGAEHVLVDPERGAVTGVIDWSDAALTDPAYDQGLLLRDLGAPPPDELRERAIFFARCALLEDLAYGLDTGRDDYAARSLAALPRVFREPAR